MESADHNLAARDISVSFGGVAALRGVSIEIAPGVILGLIGPNGAGKTTLVNVLTGFQRPTSGGVFVDRTEVTRLPPRVFTRKGIARTFQGARLFQHLTVRENVAVGLCARGEAPRVARRSVDEILDWMGLNARADQIAGSLPFGDKRRVDIARALSLAPKFLLLDEPAAGLSEEEATHLTDLVQLAPQRFGCGILLVEHNMQVIMKACTVLHVLNYGQTLAAGLAADVSRHPDVIEAYIGGSRMRFSNA